MHRIAAALVGAGLSVEVVGTGDASLGPPGATVRALARTGRARRLGRALSLPRAARGRVLLTVSPDVVLAAAVQHRLRRRPWVADVFEDYLPLLADRAWARGPAGAAARTLARAADRLAAAADVTTVADEHVPPRHARHRIVLRNLPDTAALPDPDAPRDPHPRAVYVGDVRASRGLWTMLRALELAPAWTLDVVGPVAAADAERLREWCATSPAAGRVRLHGRQSPERSWQVAEGAWAGLALLADTPAFRRAMPSKVYEYAAAGLAVLATPLPRMVEALAPTAAGELATTPEQVAAVLRGWADDPAAHAASVAAARAWWETRRAGRAAYDELAAAVAALARSGAGGHRP